jgi:hypothetical protein
MINGLSRGKQKRKNTFSFFFPTALFIYSTTGDRSFPIVFVLKFKQYLYVLVACVYCAEARDMSTSSRVLALGEKNAFYQKVFLRSHFSLMILLVIGTRRICLP